MTNPKRFWRWAWTIGAVLVLAALLPACVHTYMQPPGADTPKPPAPAPTPEQATKETP